MLPYELQIFFQLLGYFREDLADVRMTCPLDVLTQFYDQLYVSPAFFDLLLQ